MARIVRACRGDGVAYLELAGLDAPSAVEARTAEGRRLPAAMIALDEGRFAIAFPLARTRRYVLAAQDGAWSLSIGALQLKLRSKLAYALSRPAAMRLRDCDQDEGATCLSLRFIQAVEDGEACVLRARIDVPQGPADEAPIEVRAVDLGGAAIEARPILLEDCARALDERGRAVRSVTVALRLPLDERRLGLVASVADGSCQPGGCMLYDDTYAALRGGFLDLTMDASRDPSYHQWWEDGRPSEADLRAQAARVFEGGPLFSVIVPLFQTPLEFFDAMYASVCRQSYANWELVLVNASPDDSRLARRLSAIEDPRVRVLEVSNQGIARNTNAGIEAARGGYRCFLDHDDVLAPHALYEYAQAIEAHADADLLYCDEDRLDGDGRHRSPFFKPDYSPELLRAHNYVTHFLCVSKSCGDQIGPMRECCDGAQDYDYTLRAVERARRVVHVPRVLYHWRMHEASTSMNPQSKGYAKDAGLRALQDHCDRMGFAASVVRTDMPFAYRVVHAPRDWGKVDIVIPTKDKADLLESCVESILERCSYKNFRIILVENNSVEASTFDCYEALQAADARVCLATWPGPFNFSKVVNFGAAQGDAPNILLLNNDTEVLSPDFLESMLGYFEDGGVGVVGAKLLYADGTVQHAGVGVGLHGAADHLFVSLPAEAGGYFDRARLPQSLSAVTGACQLVRRSVFDQVGGYEEAFEVGYNDVDFCLKARRAGYRVAFAPEARLKHFEFYSRGRDMRGEARARALREAQLLRRRWPEIFEEGDPYLNPNFSRENCYLALGRPGHED